MKIRQGRKNPHALYLQDGDEPSDDDLSIGYVADDRIARWIVEETNDAEAGYRLEAVVIEGEHA